MFMLLTSFVMSCDSFTSSKPYAHGWLMKYIAKSDSSSSWLAVKFQKRFVVLRDGELRYFTTDQSNNLNKMSQGVTDNSTCKGVIKITAQTTVYRTLYRNVSSQLSSKCPYVLDVKVPEKRLVLRLQPMGATRGEVIRDLLLWARAISATIDQVRGENATIENPTMQSLNGEHLSFKAFLESDNDSYGYVDKLRDRSLRDAMSFTFAW